MSVPFKRSDVEVYTYTSIDSLETGDRCAVTFEDNKSFLPAQGGHLSGEAVEYLSNGEYDGLITIAENEHWTVDNGTVDDVLSPLPEPFVPIESFLEERKVIGVAESLAELLDAALIYDYDNLHSDLVEVMESQQHLLKLSRRIDDNLAEESASLKNKVRSELNSLRNGNSPDFHQASRDYFKPLSEFHSYCLELYDQLVEVVQDHENDLQKLLEDYPDPGKINTENTESKEYYKALQQKLLTRRSNLSPFTDFNVERTHEALVTPAFDNSDWEIFKTISLIKQILENFLFRGIFLSSRFEELTSLVDETIVSDKNMYRRLTFPREESDFLLSHIVNVFLLSTYIGNKLDLDSSEAEDLAIACLFFDLGMLRVPPAAWMRSEEPSNEEIEKIKKHPIYTAEWLRESYHSFNENTLSIIRRHHERLDGSGYPQKVSIDDLTLAENILIVTDVYDAMSTTRPHRPAISPDKIITYLKNRANKFEESVISVLEQYIGPYPPGTVVQLNSNEIGVTLAGGEDPQQPKVKIVIDSKGDVYDDPEIMDLQASNDKRIVETVGTRNTPSALMKFIGD